MYFGVGKNQLEDNGDVENEEEDEDEEEKYDSESGSEKSVAILGKMMWRDASTYALWRYLVNLWICLNGSR